MLRVPSLLGNSASVNFISVGDPRSEQLKKDGVMMAMEGSGMLASLVGPDNADKAREILLNIAKTAEWMRITLPRDYDSNVGPMLSNLNATVAAFKDDYENWRKPIGTSITDAASLLNRTDRMLQENEPRINRLMDDTLATLANARSITGEFKTRACPRCRSCWIAAPTRRRRWPAAWIRCSARWWATCPRWRRSCRIRARWPRS